VRTILPKLHDMQPVKRQIVTAIASVALSFVPGAVQAQRMVTVQAGVGAALDKRNDRLDGTHRHAMVAVEVTPPLLPLGARIDGMWIDTGGANSGTAAAIGNAVFTIKLPVLRPYAIAGWGQYGVGATGARTGVNAGVGLRIQAGPLRVFGEARRHWALSKDLVTVGVSF
jgi:hypothetical protein